MHTEEMHETNVVNLKENLPPEIGCIIMCVHAQLETYCSVTALFQPCIKNKYNYSDISCDEIKGKSTHTH